MAFYPGNPTDGDGNPLAAVVTFKLYGTGSGQYAVTVSADPGGVFADVVSQDDGTRSSGYQSVVAILNTAIPDMVALLG
jgi:hypothetical protein